MNQIHFKKEEMNPVIQILVLLGYAIAGAILFGIIAIVVVLLIYGMEVTGDIFSGIPSPKSVDSFKILLFTSTSIGTFLVPALALAWTEKIKIRKFYGFGKLKFDVVLYVFALFLFSIPFMEWVIELNQNMHLPSFLKSVEDWMRKAEDDAMRTTYMLLDIRNSWDLPVNILVVAIAPAIGEELMFRGGLQRSLGRMFTNPHVAIWLTAIIFSAIHVQFFGFFPRMLLGAGFGYLYFWTKNLWYPIIGHFINNATAVIIAWDMDRKNIPLDDTTSTFDLHWIWYIVSFVITIGILILIKTKTTENGRSMDSGV